MKTVAPPAHVLLVGNPEVTHVGAHLAAAATELGWKVTQLNTEDAFAGSRLVGALNWRLRGHRPARLSEFSEQLVAECRTQHPDWLLSTGIAPVDHDALVEIGRMGIERLNFLTDDPWNPAHDAPWFMKALPHYDWVFSPRRANLDDLRAHGCRQVSYLPFAYQPTLHYAEPLSTSGSAPNLTALAADVVFAGGADPDRVPPIAALIREGFATALYGGYWERYPETQQAARGHAGPDMLRRAIGASRVALCLVRRANRDGNAMRTFEVAAMGGCMLAEHTDEHEEILGPDGDAVVYFRSTAELVERAHWLLEHEDERRRLSAAAHARITGGPHRYTDRLESMVATVAATESRH